MLKIFTMQGVLEFLLPISLPAQTAIEVNAQAAKD
jgi:hypothetical protein